MVNSLDDGMNLVAKEFVASRFDNDGVLLLSRFTGAARELSDAVLVNPFAVDEVAEAIRLALEMPAEERRRRIEKMRAVVAGNNIYRWAGKIISALLRFDFPDDARSEMESASLSTPVPTDTNGGAKSSLLLRSFVASPGSDATTRTSQATLRPAAYASNRSRASSVGGRAR
jgi:hypothetical protein